MKGSAGAMFLVKERLLKHPVGQQPPVEVQLGVLGEGAYTDLWCLADKVEPLEVNAEADPFRLDKALLQRPKSVESTQEVTFRAWTFNEPPFTWSELTPHEREEFADCLSTLE